MSGLVLGERTVKRSGVSYIICEEKKLLGKVKWGRKSQSKQIQNKNIYKTADPYQ
jgi:hypothetical protein